MNLLATPKVQLALFLIAIILANLFLNFSPYLLIYFVLTISLALLSDHMFVWARKIKPFFLSAAIVSGLIIALLNSPRNSILEMFLMVVIAIASKHFLKYKGRHIFNPAAFGLFFGSLFFKNQVAWWGISSSSVVVWVLLILTGYVAIFRSRKISSILSFFIVYNILAFVLTRQFNIFDPTVIFFSLVMLPEPMTSPNRPFIQLNYGVTVAVLTYFLAKVNFLPDVLLSSLLLSNLLFANKK
ncbi:hypothetical protein HZA76_04750 [Candidatus Roizmanbacteria bacterium]|nr:hypothetical protein [Candidatus Roizmanbacteria bacterium]